MSLPKNYRIVVNGNNRFMVQRKGWIFWSNVNEYLSTWVGDYTRFPTFDSKTEACAWVTKQLKDRARALEWHKRDKSWSDAGSC
jgi:hypothetical protein